MAAKDESKNKWGLSRNLTRKTMDRTSGAESSAVARHLFFLETTITVEDVAAVATGGLDASLQGAAQSDTPDPAAVTSAAIDPTLTAVATLVPDPAVTDSTALDATLVPGAVSITPDPASVVAGTLEADFERITEVNMSAYIRAAYATALNMSVSLSAVRPVDINAILNVHQPENIPAFLRTAYTAVLDLGSSLTQVGSFEGLPALIKSLSTSYSDMLAEIEVKYPGDLRAFLHGYATTDLGASLVTERYKNLPVIIWGRVVAATSNFGAFVRQDTNGTKDMPVMGMKAVVSTHTSDKTPNLRKVGKVFYENKFLFGTRSKGLVAFVIEPVYGVFPDLHAEIFAQQYFRASLAALIRPAQRTTTEFPTTLVSVSPHIKITKITLKPQPLRELPTTLNARGGYLSMGALIRGGFSGSTGTAEDAAYTTTASTHRFILGTTKGLYIPKKNTPTIVTTTFNNNHPNPDLRASLRAWQASNIGAYLKVYNLAALPASLTSIGPDQYKDLYAFAEPAYVSDLLASLISTGEYRGLSASIESSGGISNFTASIISFINPLSYTVVPVSTKPFKDIGALINYGSMVSCAGGSQIASLSAYIRGFEGGTEDKAASLGASLNALRLTSGMPAEIVGRKLTRIRTLTLNFRASTRGSSTVNAVAVPKVETYSSLLASISGLSHEINFGASITPVRYALEDVLFTASEHAVNLRNPQNFKDVLLTFRSKVSSYVYEEIGQAIYPTEHGKWAIDLRSVKRQTSFFDRDPESRERLVSSAEGFHSIDEAIRNAISIICDGVQDNLGASIVVGGGSSNLRVSMGVTSIDKFTDMRSKLVSVQTLPDISASVNTGRQSSGYASLMTTIYSGGLAVQSSMPASLDVEVARDLGAELTVT